MHSDVQAVLVGERQWTIATGDALVLLRSMPDACLHACVTSPPYFALRDYGTGAWEGGDATCEHSEKDDRNSRPYGAGQKFHGGDNSSIRHVYKKVCGKCGAHRVDNQLGLEETPEQFVANLVDVFREVRRVLVPWGVCWVNCGDSFSSGGRTSQSTPSGSIGHRGMSNGTPTRPPVIDGYKPLDLLGIPFRLVEALRQDGWYHRDTVAWVKKAPMPSSVAGWRYERCRVKVKAGWAKETHPQAIGANGGRGADRVSGGVATGKKTGVAEFEDCPGCPKCEPNDGYVLRKGAWRMTSSWEPVFMLTPSPTYFCDQDAVRMPPAESTLSRDRYSRITATAEEEQYAARHDHETTCDPGGANPRNVLHLGPSPQSFALCRACGEYHRNVNALKKWGGKPRCPCGAQDFVAHYAAYPPALVEPLLRASTSAEGCCPTCLMPMVRVVERDEVRYRPNSASNRGNSNYDQNAYNGRPQRGAMGVDSTTLDWRPSCSCAAGPPIPMAILDPFAGTGTTLLVARRLGLRAIGLDLSPDYSSLARARVLDECPLFGG